MNESCHTWMLDATHINWSWRRATALRLLWRHIWMSDVTHMNEARHTCMFDVTHMNRSWMEANCTTPFLASYLNESCHTYERVISHIWTGVGGRQTALRLFWHHIWMSHVTHMNESCHTYEQELEGGKLHYAFFGVMTGVYATYKSGNVCCSVLQCIAVCCSSVVQSAAVCCSSLISWLVSRLPTSPVKCVVVLWCSLLPCVAVLRCHDWSLR